MIQKWFRNCFSTEMVFRLSVRKSRSRMISGVLNFRCTRQRRIEAKIRIKPSAKAPCEPLSDISKHIPARPIISISEANNLERRQIKKYPISSDFGGSSSSVLAFRLVRPALLLGSSVWLLYLDQLWTFVCRLIPDDSLTLQSYLQSKVLLAPY